MMYLLFLLTAFGLCFGFMNKATPLYGKSDFFDRMLQCSYCTGFHCGWMVWVLAFIVEGKPPMGDFESALGIAGVIISIPVWAFASSAFCYTLDTVTKLMESRTLVPDYDDDEEDSE